MATPLTDRLQSIGYERARRLMLLLGLGVLVVIALVMYVRRVDTVEVVAALLFIPVFLAFVFFRAPGGLIAGVGASIVYVLMRLPAIDAVGFGEFAGLVFSRSFAYLVFGLLGGWSNQTLETSLEKLDLYDQIDDATGLFNARFLVQDTDLEIARSQRYQTLFSVVTAEVPAAPLHELGRRRERSALRDLGRQLADSVRSVDRVVHARDGETHRFVAVLPETGTEGAAVFAARFADGIATFLGSRGAAVEARQIAHSRLTVPGDDEGLAELRERFAQLDELEHGPDAAVTVEHRG